MSFKKRVFTAFLLLPLLFCLLQFSTGPVFFVVLQIIILVALTEFYNLARRREHRPQRVLGMIFSLILATSFFWKPIEPVMALFACLLIAAVYGIFYVNSLDRLNPFPPGIALTFFGLLMISLPLQFLHLIREERGPAGLYFLFWVVFSGDTGAFLVGKFFGRHKMLPVASPKKTWEGAVGGLLSACLMSLAARILFFPAMTVVAAILFAFVIHSSAQVGDALESLFKRGAGVKDSSNLLPGHGGFMDRIDSLILSIPLFYYLLLYFGPAGVK
ncbi:MAG: phosphatidate cytidylyltransferase [Candidatus Aminicenantes bacterium]|nr:phosphatidate cytidylyltransferase [Candidatus Aminicenantes bacterium]